MNPQDEFSTLAPFRVEPIFVKRIWGSLDLRPWYDWVAEDGPVGEVWLTGDECKVATGMLAGATLAEAFAKHGESMLGIDAIEQGVAASSQNASPLLLKVIFAREKLSVQVHPDDRLAQKYGQPRGKTECWYALAAEPGAEVAVGLKDGVSLEEVERQVADGTLESSLGTLPVSPGEMIFVDAGTVHAIWPGSVLLETQQNCDVTYRLYDYGRPRELHVAKALEAIRLETMAGKVKAEVLEDRTVLVESPYFCVEKIPVNGARDGESMIGENEKASSAGPGLAYLFAAAGTARLVGQAEGAFEAVELPSRGVVAVPFAAPRWKIVDTGELDLVRITPRWPQSSAEGGAENDPEAAA